MLQITEEKTDKNYCNKDVYITILGSDVTIIENGTNRFISK